MNNSYTALIKQYYYSAYRQASEFSKQYTLADTFADEILLISFDLTLQLSVLQLKALEWEVSVDEVRYLFNICNSARIFEFLYLTFGLDMTLAKLCQMKQQQFSDCLAEIEKVLKAHTAVYLTVTKSQANQTHIQQLKASVCNILSTLLHVDYPQAEDIEIVNQTIIFA